MAQNSTENPNVLLDYIKEQYVVHGKKSRDRKMDPSMSEILSWSDHQNLKSDFKKNTSLKNPIVKYQAKIKKSSTPWMTEKQENFQPYSNVNNKTLYFPIDYTTLDKIRSEERFINKPTVISEQQPDNKQYYMDTKGKSLTSADYALRKVRSQEQLQHILKLNSSNKKVIKHKQFENVLYLDSQGNLPKQKEQYKKEQTSSLTKQQRSPKKKPLQMKKTKKKPAVIFLDPTKDAGSPQLQQRLKKIKKFNQTTRWIPNSSFTTYYGKPPFQNYGRGNTNPAVGGIIYGEYLYSHNVFPHRGNKKPKYLQSYPKAIQVAQQKGTIHPEPSRQRMSDQMTAQQIQNLKRMNPIYPKQNEFQPLKIQKPDLINSYTFSQNPELYNKQPTVEGTKIKKMTTKQKVPIPQPKKDRSRSYQKQKQKQQKHEIPVKRQSKSKSPQERAQKKKSPQQLSFFPPRQQGFYSQILKKKEKANRLALKVTEVICVNKFRQPRPNQEKTVVIERMKSLDDIHLNPQNYKNVPSVWMQRIPSAGKSIQRNYSVKDILN